ncbi:MAG: GerW family sporulation protein [Lachnospiraceae bacterium]|nr:GerW family sporulation protein [Candidatus Colinaster scatohippi]
MSNFSSTIESLLKNVDSVLSTKTVVGDAKQIGDTVIVPLVDVSFGIAAGGNSADKKNGAGGGITGKMSPSAVLVIQDGHTKLVSVKNQDTISKIVDLVPEVLDKISTKKADLPSDEVAVDTAFPDGTDSE